MRIQRARSTSADCLRLVNLISPVGSSSTLSARALVSTGLLSFLRISQAYFRPSSFSDENISVGRDVKDDMGRFEIRVSREDIGRQSSVKEHL